MKNNQNVYRGGDSRKEYVLKTDSILQLFDNSILSKPEKNDINSYLHANFNNIRQLLKERKNLLKTKFQSMIMKNKEKLHSLSYAKQQDLRNQARMLNDRSIIELVEHAQSFSKSKSLMLQVSEITNMNVYEANQRNIGKQFWDKHKEFERQKKKKAQLYTTQSRQLKQFQQRERIIFSQIQKYENQIIFHLTKGRNDPEHLNRAEKLNFQIQKRKDALRQIKVQKGKVKGSILKVIEQILQFNNAYEKVYKSRLKDLNEVVFGAQNISQFDNLIAAIEKIMVNKGSIKGQSNRGLHQLQNTIRFYDQIMQDIDKMKDTQLNIFNSINQQLRQNIRNAIMEKAFISGVPLKQQPNQLLKRLKDYKKLLSDFIQEKPRLENQLSKMGQMTSMLYPIKKDYETESDRRQQLKKEIKKLYSISLQIQGRQKQFRDYHFRVEELLHKRKILQAQINDLAEKVNLTQYKNKMKELEELNKRIGEKSNAKIIEEANTLKIQLQRGYSSLYDRYDDLISQVEIQQQNISLGLFLSKLDKRLSLI